MTVCLFPRLDSLCVEQCLENLDALIAEAGRPLSDERLPAGTGWTAIGGGQVSYNLLFELRSAVVADAKACGFPDRGSVADRARFDVLATVTLADFEPLASGEADRDDVWAFIATILLPDVAAWRYADRSFARFEGGVRNTFQRLWMRASALDLGPEAGEGRWSLVTALSEDAMVQLTERPAIGADRDLSIAIAKAWVKTAEIVGPAKMQNVMRRAIIDIRIRNEIQMLAALSSDALQKHTDRIFARAAGLEVSKEARPRLASQDNAQQPVGNAAVIEPDKSEEGTSTPTARRDPEDDAADARSDHSDTGEAAIQHAILELMLDGRAWSNGSLKLKLALILPLTDADRSVGARPSEEVWENRVNNALGRARTNSLYAKEFVENRGHGLHKITEKGAAYIREIIRSRATMTDRTVNGPTSQMSER